MDWSIPDTNLRLALLDASRADPDWVGGLEAAYEQARAAHPDWRAWDEMMDDTFEPNPDLEAFVRAQPLDFERLRALTRLTLDGDRDVYGWVGGDDWYADPAAFRIRNLSGLEGCSELEYLHLGQGMHLGCSLAPLAGLAHLRELWACALDGYSDIDAVLALPRLERLEVANVATSDERAAWEHVARALAARRGNPEPR